MSTTLWRPAPKGVTGITPCGLYSSTHLRLHRADLQQWRRPRAQALKHLPVLTPILQALEHRLTHARQWEHDEFVAQISAPKRHIDESKLRFGIG